MLALDVEFLGGISVAATPNRRDEAEWPPHPDRLFQSLVAAWGRNDPPDEEEREALEWLEALDMERLAVSAGQGHRRDVVTVYVPPNDTETTGKPGAKAPRDTVSAIRAIPEFRKNRQPRAFPAVVPTTDRVHVRYVWPEATGIEQYRRALARLVREVTYLGHSHSLVRMSLWENSTDSSADSFPSTREHRSLRLPHPGRLQHLRACYERSLKDNRIVRPRPSVVTKTFKPPKDQAPPSTMFEADNATVLADAGGFVPTLAAFPLVAKRLRDALLKCAPAGISIPPLVSGHDASRGPTDEAHIAIVPLADVGWSHSHGRLMGIALVWPRAVAAEDRRAALRILASFLRRGDDGLLHFGPDGSWRLTLEAETTRASLGFGRYARTARRWNTVLPVVLDRHPKDKPGNELADIVARACRNVGLPASAIDRLEVEIHKHSPVKGAPSVREVLQSVPADSPYRTRPFAHIALNFANPIRGPLILGAGRFRGLGLCLPVDEVVP